MFLLLQWHTRATKLTITPQALARKEQGLEAYDGDSSEPFT